MIHRDGHTLSREEQKAEFAKMVELRGGEYCNDCYDRGYTSWDVKNEFYVPCECLMKAARKLEQEKLASMKVSKN